MYAKCCPNILIAVEQILYYMLLYCIVALNLHYVHSLDSVPTVFMWLVDPEIDRVVDSDRSAPDALQLISRLTGFGWSLWCFSSMVRLT